jgi:inositol phosphorylceramide synthase catalytic subunit
MRIWPVDLGGTTGTPHDWFLVHHSTALDLLCAVPYGTFIIAILALVVYFYFKDQSRMHQLGWTFLALNLSGFVTYHLLPAAPPWYFHEHGCVVDMTVKASEGMRLAHVDQLLHYGYFASIYGRASDVFGALPSLHVAYALLIVLCGYRVFGPVLRVTSILYFALMCFGAVYLDHHWIVDILLGIVYTLAVYPAVRAIVRATERAVARRSRRPSWEPPAPTELGEADGA